MRSVSVRQGWPLLLVFLTIVLGMGAVVGLIAAPGEYVRGLNVPPLVLPEIVSGALWVALSAAFAFAGWRLWVADSNSTEMRVWLAVLILSWWFSPTFFIMRAPLLAMLVVAAILALFVWLTASTWRSDRISFWLLLPSVPYLGYVTAMTAGIVLMN